MRHSPLELGEDVAPQIDVARILRSKVNGDNQGLAQFGERELIGGGKGVAAVLGNIDRSPDLCRQADDGGGHAYADCGSSLGADPHARMQPHRRECGKATDRREHAQQKTCRQEPLLERTQRLRQRQLGYPPEHARLPDERKVEHPGADGEGEGDDRRRRRAVGDARREQRDGADQQAVEYMAADEIERFGKVEMSTHCQPDHKGRGSAEDGSKPAGEDRRHLGDDQSWNAIRQLNEQRERARFFFAPEGSNRHEWEQQRCSEVKTAKGRHQYPIERREPAPQHRRIGRSRARFVVERDRLKKAVAHERAQDQQHGPERAAARDLPQLLAEQRAHRGTMHNGRLR